MAHPVVPVSPKPWMSILVGRSGLKWDWPKTDMLPMINLSGSLGLSFVQRRKSTSFSTSNIWLALRLLEKLGLVQIILKLSGLKILLLSETLSRPLHIT